MVGELGAAWSKAYNILKHDNSEKHIRGVMSNLISMLLKAKWDPSTMNRWTGEDNIKWVMSGTKVSPDMVAAALNKQFFSIELARAAGHYLGKGLENGLHVNATLSWLRNIKGNNSNIKAILETLLAGAMEKYERNSRTSEIEYWREDILRRDATSASMGRVELITDEEKQDCNIVVEDLVNKLQENAPPTMACYQLDKAEAQVASQADRL